MLYVESPTARRAAPPAHLGGHKWRDITKKRQGQVKICYNCALCCNLRPESLSRPDQRLERPAVGTQQDMLISGLFWLDRKLGVSREDSSACRTGSMAAFLGGL